MFSQWWMSSFQINHRSLPQAFRRPLADCRLGLSPYVIRKNVNFLLFYYNWASVDFSQEHASVHSEQIEGKKGFGGLEHAPGALFAGECEVGVSLISSTHKRLAPVCLAATSLSVCFISACQALSGRLVLLLLPGSGPWTAGPTECILTHGAGHCSYNIEQSSCFL